MDRFEKEKVFSEVYAFYKGRIKRICYGYIYESQQVEDLFQEIMINIWNSLDRFRGESNIGTWVYKVAVNTALLYNRKIKFYSKIKLSVQEIGINTDNEIDEINTREDKLKQLALCISKLQRNDRLIITLILEDLSYEQVSEIIGITPNHVGVKVNRIKKKLFTMINDMNYE